MSDIIRVLRVIEYVGPRERVEQVLQKSLHGVNHFGALTISAATVNQTEMEGPGVSLAPAPPCYDVAVEAEKVSGG